MLTILHGENTIKSRARLVTILDSLKSDGCTIVRLDAKSLTIATLEETLGSQSLFGEQKALCVEELHSLPTSQKKKDCIELLASADHLPIILWEKRALTKTMLKPFANAKVEEFKLSSSLFSWLDALGTKLALAKKLSLLHEALLSDGEYFCFLMLIRQIRLLIQAKEGSEIAGPPFMKAKLQKQSAQLPLEALVATYHRLVRIDQQQKTSQSGLTLAQELDLLTLEI